MAVKDANTLPKFKLSSKKSSEPGNSKVHGPDEERNILDSTTGDTPTEADLTVILESNFEIRDRKSHLTAENLANFQRELVRKETECVGSTSGLLNSDYRHQMPLRLWLLFELEIIGDGQSNLRSLYYFNGVYRGIDPDWYMRKESVMEEKIPEGYEEFPIEQLLIPTLQVEPTTKESGAQDPEEGIVDIVEKEHAKIPSSVLAKRNLKSIFDQTPVKARKILAEESLLDTESLREKAAVPNKKRCTISKKLSIMGGHKSPQLSGRQNT